MRHRLIALMVSAPLTSLFLICGLAVASDAPFYQGKTLAVILGGTAGGTGDLRIRAVTKYLQKYLPGSPTILQQYMPGAGGTTAANHLANLSKRDGLTMLVIGSSIYSNAILGGTGVHYKLEDFVFLGSPSSGGPYMLLVRPGLGLDTAGKLKAHESLRFAQRSVGHVMYVLDRMFAFVLELKEPKWVLGYDSSEINQAVERGEADAQTTNPHAFMRATPHWLKEGFSVPILMKDLTGKGVEGISGFPQDRPYVDGYVDTKLKEAVIRFHHAIRPGGTVFFTQRGIPEPALKALREAFNKTWKDPQFAEEYQRLTGEPTSPVTGEEIHQALRQIPTDPKVVEVYRRIIGGGPLPPAR